MSLDRRFTASHEVHFVRLRGSVDRRHGNGWEAFAPPGYRFVGGAHSLILEHKEDLDEDLELCPPDCDCRENEP